MINVLAPAVNTTDNWSKFAGKTAFFWLVAVFS
jgi:hypothetical protein